MTQRASGEIVTKTERGWFGTLLRLVLGPIFFWLDLYGPDGRRPSNSKVIYSGAVVVCLVALVVFGRQQIASDKPIDLSFVMFATAVMAFAAGHDTYKTWLKTRAGGLADAAPTIAANEPKRDEIRSQMIAARRQQGSAEHEGTEPAT